MKPLMHQLSTENGTGHVTGLKIQLKRLQQLGWQGILGLTLVMGSVVLGLSMLLPGILHIQQLELDVAQLKTQKTGPSITANEVSTLSMLNSFYDFLPTENKANQQIAVLLDAADAHQIEIEQVEYILKRDAIAKLSHYQVTLPIQGRYVDIRRFVIEVMNRMPFAAVNELRLSRENTQTEEINASLKLTAYLKQ